MAKTYRCYLPEQSLLLPPDLRDWLPDDHLAYFVSELVDDGVTGGVFASLEALIDGMPEVLALDRAQVRARAVERFGPDRMVDEHVEVYTRLVAARRRAERTA